MLNLCHKARGNPSTRTNFPMYSSKRIDWFIRPQVIGSPVVDFKIINRDTVPSIWRHRKFPVVTIIDRIRFVSLVKTTSGHKIAAAVIKRNTGAFC